MLVLLFLLSGATSLVYESIWARQLHLVVGTSQIAIAIVLAAFMAGLALGGLGAARYGSSVKRPLLAFAAAEGLIAIYALCFDFLIESATPVYLVLSSALSEYPGALVASQFVVLGAILLPPTACMGATLPLLARLVSPGQSDVGSQVGRLYGANTIGAVLGTAIAGFWLLPLLGLAATTRCTAAANVLVALVAVLLAKGRAPLTVAPLHEASARGADTSGRAVAPLVAISALAGYASLLCEVAWFRLMTLVLGASAYSFTIMLLGFLLGIGLGGWAGGRLADRIHSQAGSRGVLRYLAGILTGVAVVCWAAMFAYSELPYVFAWLFSIVQPGLPLFAAKLAICLCIMLAPALLMGASFSFLVRAAVEPGTEMSRTVGWLYGANTAGAIAGASLGGLVLLPALQMNGTVLAAASIELVAAAFALSLSSQPGVRFRRVLAFGGLACTCIAFIHWQKPQWDALMMSSGMYQYASSLPNPTRQGVREFAVAPFELLYYEEGLSSVVTVARNRKTKSVWLANNGKVDASSGGDMQTQIMLAHLPGLLGYRAERALVIGLASGVSAGSLLLDRRIEVVDIAELEPAVVRASHFFDSVNNRPLDDPRTRLRLNDARNHLMRAADGSYDLVVSEPSNPWISGVANLFTREFFALGRSKLSSDGVWAQWVNVYNTSPDDLRSLLATFADVYPGVAVFRVGESDLVLIGANEPVALDVGNMDAYVKDNRKIASDLNRVGLNSAEDILSQFYFGRSALLALSGEIGLNTDDNMRIEFSTPLTLHKQTAHSNLQMLEAAAEIPFEAVRVARLGRLAASYAQRDLGRQRALTTIRRAMRERPDDLALAQVQTRLFEAGRPVRAD